MQVCSECNENKSVTEFYGAKKQCKECKRYKRNENYHNKKSNIVITENNSIKNDLEEAEKLEAMKRLHDDPYIAKLIYNDSLPDEPPPIRQPEKLSKSDPYITKLINENKEEVPKVQVKPNINFIPSENPKTESSTAKLKNLTPVQFKTYDEDSNDDEDVVYTVNNTNTKSSKTKNTKSLDDKINIKKFLLDTIRLEKMHFIDEYINLNSNGNTIIDEYSTIPSKLFNLERKIITNHNENKRWSDTIYNFYIPSIYNKINDVNGVTDTKIKDIVASFDSKIEESKDLSRQENIELRKCIDDIRKEFDNKLEDIDSKNAKRVLEYQLKVIEVNSKNEDKISELHNIINQKDDEIRHLKKKLSLIKFNAYV